MDFHPVLTCRQSAEFEELLFGSCLQKQQLAMQEAGNAIAEEFLSEFGSRMPKDANILCLCGKGHNGGDALIASKRILKDFNQARLSVLIDPPETLKPNTRNALSALAHCRRDNIRIINWTDKKCLEGEKFFLIVEGISGMNFMPPMRPDMAERVAFANSAQADIKISIDLPAGISDEMDAPEAFRADATYAAGIAKTPIFKAFNARFTGRIRYADIGFFGGKYKASSIAQKFVESAEPKEFIASPSLLRRLGKIRPALCDKRDFGRILIIGGSESFPGAPLMNVKAALRSGAGIVNALVPKFCTAQFAASEPSAIWSGAKTDNNGSISEENIPLAKALAERSDAIAAGSGMANSPSARKLISELLKEFPDKPFVLDADAISAEAAAILPLRNAPALLTPHAGEFLRLAADASDESLVETSMRLKSHILLKGAISKISRGDKIFLLTSGSPALARGGSGDFLCGLCGGIIARSAKTGNCDPFISACIASEWLGRAGRLAAAKFSENSLSAENFSEAISESARFF